MIQKSYLNLGCGRVILPASRPAHHALVDEAIYDYPLWHNVDRNNMPGVSECLDIFRYPWPWPDNSFDAALLTHIVEHIPHEIRIHAGDDPVRPEVSRVLQCQDGWYAFFAELYRVLTPGAIAHILAPYGWSQGAITDPTHTRMVTEQTFTHSMKPDENSPFAYETGGIHFELLDTRYTYTELFSQYQMPFAFMTSLNAAYELYVKLEAVK